MPIETAIVVLAIVVPFAVFMGVLGWGEAQTRRFRRDAAAPEPAE